MVKNGGATRTASRCKNEKSKKMPFKPRNLKITAVGDGLVGKTCMLITYTSQEFPVEYEPTVFDNYPCKVDVDDVNHDVTLWDTAGQEDYERLRPLSYPNTDCFLLCYAVNIRSSFDNIVQKWYPELNHYCPKVPIILVATKCDLRGTEQECVIPKMGQKMRKRIKAYKHMECSALKNEGVSEIFEEAVRCVVHKHSSRQKCCIVL